MKKILFEVSEELKAAIDSAKGSAPRNPWLESELWRLKSIRDGAATAGVEKPDRPIEGRGKHERPNP